MSAHQETKPLCSIREHWDTHTACTYRHLDHELTNGRSVDAAGTMRVLWMREAVTVISATTHTSIGCVDHGRWIAMGHSKELIFHRRVGWHPYKGFHKLLVSDRKGRGNCTAICGAKK
jgi:hypothetical protein